MPARGIRRTLSSLGCIALVLSACSDSTTFDASAAGSYELTRINGTVPPYSLPGTPAGTTVVVLSGDLILLDNGRFDEVIRSRLTTPDTTVTTSAHTVGDVSASGGSITFKPRFEDNYSGTYTANTVTYTKQASATVSVSFEFTRSN